MQSQIVSRQRVADHGEVLTGSREINAMLDLLKQETERIDSRFLEPACGNGNFLAEILDRKLAVVEKRYRKSQLEYERYAVLAVSSLYGIDILADNVQQCRERLFGIFESHYIRLFKKWTKAKCKDSVRFILGLNIIWGDALTLMTVGEQPHPIVFSEWSPVNGSLLKRRDFTFRSLMAYERNKELPLFPNLGDETRKEALLFSDLGDEVFIPTPAKEYPSVHFLALACV
jgi:SAM-dependent methyltransferase